jgi:hypothetical protein
MLEYCGTVDPRKGRDGMCLRVGVGWLGDDEEVVVLPLACVTALADAETVLFQRQRVDV